MFEEEESNMFCQKCGSQNKENVNFCENCGASLAAPAAAQPVAQQPVAQQPVAPPPPAVPPQQYAPPQYVQPQYTQPQYVAPAPVKKKKKTGLIIVLVVLLVLVLGGVAVFAVYMLGSDDDGSDAEYAAKWYTEAVFDFDYDEAERYSFIKIEEYFEFEEGMYLDELKDTFKNAKEAAYLELEGEFGDNAKVTVSVTGSEVLMGDDIETAINSVDLDEYFFKGDIENITQVTLLLELKGDDDEVSNILDLYVVESGSGWYVLDGLSIILEFLDY